MLLKPDRNQVQIHGEVLDITERVSKDFIPPPKEDKVRRTHAHTATHVLQMLATVLHANQSKPARVDPPRFVARVGM